MNKYVKLWKYIQKSNEEKIILSFDQIKKILGFDIDHSFLNCKKQLIDYGYEVFKISLKEKYIIFNKIH